MSHHLNPCLLCTALLFICSFSLFFIRLSDSSKVWLVDWRNGQSSPSTHRPGGNPASVVLPQPDQVSTGRSLKPPWCDVWPVTNMMLILSKNCRMDSDIEKKRQNAIEQVWHSSFSFVSKCFIYIQIVFLCFFFTFPSAVKVFHQRDHCTVSVDNSKCSERLSAQNEM